jgi:hypothetical protein
MADSSWEQELAKQKRRILWITVSIAGAIIIAALFIRNNSDLFSKSAVSGVLAVSGNPENAGTPAAVAPPLSGTPGNAAKPAEQPMPTASEDPGNAGTTAGHPAPAAAAAPASGKQEDSGKPATPPMQAANAPAVSENPKKAGKPPGYPATAPASQNPEKAGKPETGLRRRIELSGITCSPADRPDVRVTLCLRLSCAGGRAEREILFKREDLKVMAHSVVSKLLMADITAEKLRPALITAMNRILSDGAIDTIDVARFEIDTKR